MINKDSLTHHISQQFNAELEEVRAGWVRLDGDFDALVAMPHLGPVDRRDGHSSAVVPVAAVPPGAHRRVHSLGLDDLVTALTDTHWEGR